MERRPMPMTSAECVAKGASSSFSHRYPACVTPDGPLLVGGGGGTRRRASVVPGIISASALTEKQRKRNGRGTTYSQRRRCKHLLSSFARSCFQSCSGVPGKKEFRRENERACSHSCQFALFLSRAVTTHRETIAARAVLYMETVLSPFSACLIKPLTKTTFRFSFFLAFLAAALLVTCSLSSQPGRGIFLVEQAGLR